MYGRGRGISQISIEMERPSLTSALEELSTLASQWENLASHANLPPDVVESLKSHGGPNWEGDALREVIRHWLEGLGQDVSWADLLEVVQDIDSELAVGLREKHCSASGSDGALEGGQVEKEGEEGSGKVDGQPDDERVVDEGDATAHVFSETWSKLSRDDIVDRVKGLIYGQAIGDALGLATEFMNKKEAHGYYKNGLSYENIVQDFHRSRWQQGDWTDDTDQMLLIMLMLIEKNGRVDQLDFAAKIHNWMCRGFAELGDVGGMGIGMTVGRTLQHPSFLKDPTSAAQEVWERSGRYLAANGAIMRTSVLGSLCFNDITKVAVNTVDIAQVTHADPRCSASCVAVTTAIALMLQGAYDPSKKHDLLALVKAATAEGVKYLEHKDQIKEMKKYIDSSLKEMKLDNIKTIGYTFKALGAGFYGLRKGTDFEKTITEVIMEGGDADSNASVCGALMGCKLGFKALPADLLKFQHRDWLDVKVDMFLKTIGLA